MSELAKIRPRSCSTAEMEQVGAELLNPASVLLRCRQCGATGSPDLRPGGRLPRGYWPCPQGCNRREVVR